jgi:hypothetical protein
MNCGRRVVVDREELRRLCRVGAPIGELVVRFQRDVPVLLDELESIDTERKRFEGLFYDYSEEVENLQLERRQLEAEVEQLRSALGFYASENNWTDYQWDHELHCYSLIAPADKGQTARLTLQGNFSHAAYVAALEQQRATCDHDWTERATATVLVCARCGAAKVSS